MMVKRKRPDFLFCIIIYTFNIQSCPAEFFLFNTIFLTLKSSSMKQFKFLSSTAIVMLMLFSCNSGSNEKTTSTDSITAATVTDTTKQMQPEKPAMPAMTLLVRHKVANFNKWMTAYEGHDSARVAYGLHNFVVGRSIKDSNMVMVALHMDDTAKAREFTMLPDLKAAMKKAGVLGTPTFMYAVNRWHDNSTDASTTRVLVNQKVKDYDAWKKVFDSHKQARMDAGLTDRAVSQFINDPHMVSVVLVVNDMKKAEDFMHSKDLKDKMAEAGVEGTPDIFFYRVVKQW